MVGYTRWVWTDFTGLAGIVGIRWQDYWIIAQTRGALIQHSILFDPPPPSPPEVLWRHHRKSKTQAENRENLWTRFHMIFSWPFQHPEQLCVFEINLTWQKVTLHFTWNLFHIIFMFWHVSSFFPCFLYNLHVLCWWVFFLTGSFFFFFLKKYFWQTHTHVLFWGHWYPCFGFLVTSPLGFKARVGCHIRIAGANVMYIPWDPPLVLHVANLMTDSIVRRRLGSYLAQGYYWHQWGSNTRSRDHEFYVLTGSYSADPARSRTILRYSRYMTPEARCDNAAKKKGENNPQFQVWKYLTTEF